MFASGREDIGLCRDEANHVLCLKEARFQLSLQFFDRDSLGVGKPGRLRVHWEF